MALHFTPNADRYRLERYRSSDFAKIIFPVFGTVCETILFAWWLAVVGMFLLVAAGFCV
jgi:hypothetical protein